MPIGDSSPAFSYVRVSTYTIYPHTVGLQVCCQLVRVQVSPNTICSHLAGCSMFIIFYYRYTVLGAHLSFCLFLRHILQ